MGKTALAANIGVNAAQRYAQTGGKEGAAVGFFLLDMLGEPLGQRVLAEQSGISSDAMRKGQVQPGDFHCFAEITQQHAGWESCLSDAADMTEAIIAKQWMEPIGVEKLSFSPKLTRLTDF